MTRRKKIKIGIGVLLVGIVLWQFGFFSRYNYLTAKIDIMREQPRIVEIGVPSYFGVAYIGLDESYGFHQSNVGCLISTPQLRGIDSYNSKVEKYLIKRNGKDWRKKYQKEIDSIIKQKLTE
jgi:hypothetical protein